MVFDEAMREMYRRRYIERPIPGRGLPAEHRSKLSELDLCEYARAQDREFGQREGMPVTPEIALVCCEARS